ncbi:mRNA cap guanine-N7 methyltransferase [Elasticomyces elasticus]|nr:mRNA cap guanine-N7 methyltransferase [Elasticomyces elasticus]
MADSEQASNVTAPRPIQKRKRDNNSANARLSNKSARTSTPNAYARRTPPPVPIEDDDDTGRRSPPKQRKRPGAGARITREQQDAARKEREEAEKKRLAERQAQLGSADLVAEHYNAVPERGREWRKTDSQIKGLRSLNNWIKSTLIQKFSRPEGGVIPEHGLTVLDMACGKGGDLGKWEKAPVVPALYVGCDIADISVEQAKERYAETMRKNGRHRRQAQMEAQFYVQDTFGKPLSNIPIINQVGFDPNAGPGPRVIQGGMGSGGFDVVSMMFALHYSFESETLARGMLKNVAGALKKGGKFIGVMPNSDIISATVKKLLQAEAPGATPAGKDKSATPRENGDEDEDDWDPEKPSETHRPDAEDDWDPEKPSEPAPPAGNGTASAADNDEDDWDPEKPSEPNAPIDGVAEEHLQHNGTPAQATTATPVAEQPPLEWGNSIYTIRFPRAQPLTNRALPRDGIFRPPYGWKYHYELQEAVNAPEFVVPWEGFRALAEDYGLELLYRKGFREVFEDESSDKELGMLAERMGVMSRDRSQGRDGNGLMVSEEEMEAAAFYHAFVFYKNDSDRTRSRIA